MRTHIYRTAPNITVSVVVMFGNCFAWPFGHKKPSVIKICTRIYKSSTLWCSARVSSLISSNPWSLFIFIGVGLFSHVVDISYQMCSFCYRSRHILGYVKRNWHILSHVTNWSDLMCNFCCRSWHILSALSNGVDWQL